jgi:hypothetical protein
MTATLDTERLLRDHFHVTADSTVADRHLDAILAATAGRRQEPAWLASLRSISMTVSARSIGRPSTGVSWAILLVLVLLAFGAVVVVGAAGWRPFPAPTANGPIVFGRFDPDLGDTVVYVARPDGSSERVLMPGAHECPQVSPDGRHVSTAFVDGEGHVAIAIADIDGANRRVLSNPDLNLGCPTWSPDGTTLAIEAFDLSDRSRNGIYLAAIGDGEDLVRLTTSSDGQNHIPGDFSPDGRELAYVHRNEGGGGQLRVVDLATGANRQPSPAVVDGGASWTPDGAWIVADLQERFLLVRPDGSESRTLEVPVEHRTLGDPRISPDGTRIVFHMEVPGTTGNDIYTMRLDGTDLQQVTDTPDVTEYFTDWGVDPS